MKSSWDGWGSIVSCERCFNAGVMQEYAKHEAQAEVAMRPGGWLVRLMPEAFRSRKTYGT